LDILFSILSMCTYQKIVKFFYVFSFYGLEILSKNFGKSRNVFLKNIDISNPKFCHKFHHAMFIFILYFLAFW